MSARKVGDNVLAKELADRLFREALMRHNPVLARPLIIQAHEEGEIQEVQRLALRVLEFAPYDQWMRGYVPNFSPNVQEQLFEPISLSYLASHSLDGTPTAAYVNQCWKCRTMINSEEDERCQKCRMFVCRSCNACLCGYQSGDARVDFGLSE